MNRAITDYEELLDHPLLIQEIGEHMVNFYLEIMERHRLGVDDPMEDEEEVYVNGGDCVDALSVALDRAFEKMNNEPNTTI